MTIRTGEPWGLPGALAEGAPVFADDASAAAMLQHLLDDELPFGEIGLTGGDLHRTLGSPRHDIDDLRSGRGMRLPVDLGTVEFDDLRSTTRTVRRRVVLAHLVAFADRRARWWHTRTVVAMNAAFIGDANLGPRAHPNDGRLDVTDGALSWSDRRRATARAVTGTHLPHPALSERRVRELVVEDRHPMRLVVDGVTVGETDRFTVRCLPDALTVVV